MKITFLLIYFVDIVILRTLILYFWQLRIQEFASWGNVPHELLGLDEVDSIGRIDEA